jgi:hypothetical protein
MRYMPTDNTSPQGGRTNYHKTKFVHTLNGTACAVPRMIVAILGELPTSLHHYLPLLLTLTNE